MAERTSTNQFARAANPSAEKTPRFPGRDQFLGLQFWVEIDEILIAGFSECSAPTMETEVFEYNEGGENSFTHKLPVRHKYGNITLKRGLDETRDLWQWYQQSIEGKAKRRKVVIQIFGPSPNGQALRTYELRRAFPVKWSGPDMKADAGAVAVETLELAHEGLTITDHAGKK